MQASRALAMYSTNFPSVASSEMRIVTMESDSNDTECLQCQDTKISGIQQGGANIPTLTWLQILLQGSFQFFRHLNTIGNGQLGACLGKVFDCANILFRSITKKIHRIELLLNNSAAKKSKALSLKIFLLKKLECRSTSAQPTVNTSLKKTHPKNQKKLNFSFSCKNYSSVLLFTFHVKSSVVYTDPSSELIQTRAEIWRTKRILTDLLTCNVLFLHSLIFFCDESTFPKKFFDCLREVQLQCSLIMRELN